MKKKFFAVLFLPLFSFSQDWKKKYDEVNTLTLGNLYAVKLNNKAAVINAKGEEVTPFIYDNVFTFDLKDFFEVRKNLKTGIINTSGQEIIPPIFDEVGILYDKSNILFKTYNKGSGYGIATLDGKIIFTPNFNDVQRISSTYLLVTKFFDYKTYRMGLYDITGREVFPLIFKFIKPYELGKFKLFYVDAVNFYLAFYLKNKKRS
jgi:hypothetical protein